MDSEDKDLPELKKDEIAPGNQPESVGHSESLNAVSSVKSEEQPQEKSSVLTSDTTDLENASKTNPENEETDLSEVSPAADEQSKEDADEYEYTKRDSFTSEIYKISITNLPKRFGFAELKKKLTNQLSLKPVKMKVWKDVCFVTFRCEEDREEALKKIEGYKWRGQPLKASIARPAADPLMRKRKQEQEGNFGCSKDKKPRDMEEDGLTPAERLKNSVTPLWKLSYEEQLKKKQEEMAGFCKKLYRQLDRNCPDIRAWLQQQKHSNAGSPCELLGIKPSPQTEGYRNKCEFTVGPGQNGEETVVGFRYGLYAKGSVCVGSPTEVAFLPQTMKTVVQLFQQFLCSNEYGAFHPDTHKGHWRQLTVRTSRLGHIMMMVDFHPQDLTQEAIDAEIDRLKQFFLNGEGKAGSVTSCFFRSNSERMTAAAEESPYKLVFGDEHITESLLGMKFRISPNAFFQVNTEAAEVLYSQVSDWCSHSATTTVLDVCCGTGTIGLTVAKDVERVIGVEMCPEAIRDAQFNAQLNGVSNVEYHCAKAEDVMKMITKSVRTAGDVVAIVDPPRGGLHSSVVVALRNCRSINRLVYVSCNANGALNNFIDLVRPVSKRLKGPRFLPVKAIPVDLFPHTNHCELVMLFEREKSETKYDDSD